MPGMPTKQAQPRARVLSVGDELVLGRVVDTNATFLCRLLTDRGFRVLGSRQVGDGLADLVEALRASAADTELVLVSGGLGPTDDDRTRHALAEAMGSDLREHAPSWAAIVRRYAQVAPGRELPANNRRQALVPRGATTIPNDRGTAPGMIGSVGGSVVAVFPGVPHEMRAMAERFAATLPRRFPRLRVPVVGEVFFSGIGESAAQQRLGDLLTEEDPMVGITVSELGHITLRVVGTKAQVASRLRRMRTALAEHLLPGAGLAPSLIGDLTVSKGTITAAESCTGGHIAAQLTAVPGASTVLRSSLVTYHAQAKEDLLGVPRSVARKQTVSEACARAMAIGARSAAGATIAISATGYAGPGGGTAADPVGTVWVGVATAAGSAARRVFIQGVRERIQARAAAAGLQLAWDALQGRVTLG